MKRILFGTILCACAFIAEADNFRVNSFKQEKSEYQANEVKIREITDPIKVSGQGISPFAINFLPGIQIPNENWDIFLFRINILVGRQNNVFGLDFASIGNEVKNNFIGVQSAGIYNKIGYSDGALQVAGMLNRSQGDFYGIQVASFVNSTEGKMTGLQVAIVNSATTLDGVQIGLLNLAQAGSGVQIGIWNSAKNFEGLQIGLGNYNEGSSLEFSPIMNLGF